MALTPGTRLGAYEIAGPLGAGGMGEVYRALDLTLGRQVAVKVLPEAFADDAERVVVHRDLKPANVKVRDDGTVKVLDFGLAVSTPAMTQTGVILVEV